jgi:type I restriction enzyme S subunit
MSTDSSTGTLPEGWRVEKLSDLCEKGKDSIVDGPFGSNLKRSDYLESGIPVLKLQNIKQNLIIQKNMDFVSVEKYNQLRRHTFRKSDIVMTKLGDPLGVSATVDDIERGVIVADLVRIRPNKVNVKFLCYQLNSPIVSKYINDNQKGTTRPRINLSIVRDLRLNIPPPPEQEKIVEILEEQLSRLDAATVALVSATGRLNALTRSIAHAAVGRGAYGLPLVELSKVLELHRGYDLPKQNRIAGPVPIVASSGVVGSHIESKVKGPGVVTGRSGTIGKVQVVADDFWPLNTTLYVSDFMGNHFGYIALLLESLNLPQHAGGSTVPSLDRNVLKFLQVRVPDFATQAESALWAQRMQELVLPLSREFASWAQRFQALRRSLLHAAFTGNLTKEWRENSHV